MEQFKDIKNIRKKVFRPYGKILSESNFEEMVNDAKIMVQNLMNQKGVIGITLSGGLSRGYGDELSEIDLIIYLEDDIHRQWSIGMGPIPQGDILWDGKYFDIKFLSFQEEISKDWDLLKRWDASYQKILFDPLGKIADLLEQKDSIREEDLKRKILSTALDCCYLGVFVPQQWIKRGDPLAANQIINKALMSLVDLIFLINLEYPPYEKWALNYSYSLKWLPKDWEVNISNILIVKELSLEEAKRRCKLFNIVYNECWERIVGLDLKDLGPIEIKELQELLFIAQNSPLPIEEFAAKFELNSLSYEPIFKLTKIIEKNNKKFILFDIEKFQEQKEANFADFLDWNKDLLEKLTLN